MGCGFRWISVENFTARGVSVLFLPFFRVFQRGGTAFHRTFPMPLDIHIFPVRTLESFQNGFPQLVENFCGYVDKLRFPGTFRGIFPCFLSKQRSEAEFFSVKFARNSGYPHFQTQFHRLWKTCPETPHFPQIPQISGKNSGRFSMTVRAEKSFPTDAGDRKIRLETASEKTNFFRNHEITPDFRKIADFHLILHPFWEVGFVKILRFPKSIHKKERKRHGGIFRQNAEKSRFQTIHAPKSAKNRRFYPEEQVFHKAHTPYYCYY